jgi:hypothetical protein
MSVLRLRAPYVVSVGASSDVARAYKIDVAVNALYDEIEVWWKSLARTPAPEHEAFLFFQAFRSWATDWAVYFDANNGSAWPYKPDFTDAELGAWDKALRGSDIIDGWRQRFDRQKKAVAEEGPLPAPKPSGSLTAKKPTTPDGSLTAPDAAPSDESSTGKAILIIGVLLAATTKFLGLW